MSNFYTSYIKGNRLNLLIAINVAVFILINVLDLLGVDLTLLLAASDSGYVMLHRPWTIVTHMFTHDSVGHILFNMLALFFMGQFFLQMQSARRLTTLYLLAGLGGYVLFFLYFGWVKNLPGSAIVLGASAAVMGIVVASAVLRPLQPIHLFGIIRLELRWFALIMVLIDLFSIKDGVNSGGHVGHIGGAITGFFYAQYLIKGAYFPAFKWKMPWSGSRMKVAHKHSRPKSDDQFNAERKARQDRMDIILDKISRSGYDSLTKEEKEFLFQQAQK